MLLVYNKGFRCTVVSKEKALLLLLLLEVPVVCPGSAANLKASSCKAPKEIF